MGKPEPTRPVTEDGSGHAIRNLVQAIDGYLELAARRTDDADVRHYLESARTAANELVALTRQLDTERADRA